MAHLYGLSADDFAHILDTFPRVFPPDDAGQAKKERLLGVYERFGDVVAGWEGICQRGGGWVCPKF